MPAPLGPRSAIASPRRTLRLTSIDDLTPLIGLAELAGDEPAFAAQHGPFQAGSRKRLRCRARPRTGCEAGVSIIAVIAAAILLRPAEIAGDPVLLDLELRLVFGEKPITLTLRPLPFRFPAAGKKPKEPAEHTGAAIGRDRFYHGEVVGIGVQTNALEIRRQRVCGSSLPAVLPDVFDASSSLLFGMNMLWTWPVTTA